MARPKIPNHLQQTERVVIYVTEETKAMLDALARKNNIGVSIQGKFFLEEGLKNSEKINPVNGIVYDRRAN